MEAINSRDKALQLLQTYFGYTSFRPAQEAPCRVLIKERGCSGHHAYWGR